VAHAIGLQLPVLAGTPLPATRLTGKIDRSQNH
jgi:hypothetical protein